MKFTGEPMALAAPAFSFSGPPRLKASPTDAAVAAWAAGLSDAEHLLIKCSRRGSASTHLLWHVQQFGLLAR
jgi:hypothetical protein